MIWKIRQNIQTQICFAIFQKCDKFPSRFYFFHCAYKNMNLRKNSQSNYNK